MKIIISNNGSRSLIVSDQNKAVIFSDYDLWQQKINIHDNDDDNLKNILAGTADFYDILSNNIDIKIYNFDDIIKNSIILAEEV
jgi:hypothetical protein